MDFPRDNFDGRLQIVGDSVKEDLTNFAENVRVGLAHRPKYLPCRYIYDKRGSELFEQICELPEYYATRCEGEILHDRRDEIEDALPAGCALVELGSGSSVKTRIVLEGLLKKRRELEYVPVDVSRHMLQEAAVGLLKDFPGLRIAAVAGDYTTGVRFAKEHVDGPTCFLFLGSSIGNFDRPDAVTFLRMIAEKMTDGDCLLIGIDLRKSREILERAYDDAQGVTAAFNKNILVRINRELGGEFDVDAFRHRAWFNDSIGRVELHLHSVVDQAVRIKQLALNVEFTTGESIHTENSYKYSESEIDTLGRDAGLATKDRWFDSGKRFSLNLFVRRANTRL